MAKFCAALIAFLALCCPLARAQLPDRVQALLRANNMADDVVGLIAFRARDGAPIMSSGADRAMQPASTLKVLTSIVALERLGPTYRGGVELRATGAVVDGVLERDLILRGMGSPDFGWEDFRRVLQDVRSHGLRDIRGDFIVDRGFFNPPRLDVGLPPFDDAPEFQYNVIPDALSLNGNLLQFDLVADDNSLRTWTTPLLDRVEIAYQIRLIDRVCDKWEDGWKVPTTTKAANGVITVTLRGDFPRNCKIKTSINVVDRADYVARLFQSVWRDIGGSFSGSVREQVGPTESKLLARHQSRTLAEFARDINKRSDNPMTRLTFLTLGSSALKRVQAVGTAPSADVATLALAEREVRGWLREHNIDDTGLVLENGSGLSRIERIKPAQLAAVLKAAYSSDWAVEFQATLPIIGVDGAMRTRLATTAALRKGRIKTGSLRDVGAVAGYVPNAAGEMCVVVAMINHERAGARIARPVLDAILEAVIASPNP